MITEDYVSFEIAKLLKEKGFDECPLFRYDDCGELWVQGGYDKTIKWHFPAPTLQMAMKWLREVHNWNVVICKSHTIYGYDANIESLTANHIVEVGYEKTYEEACEAAIKYCLKHLI